MCLLKDFINRNATKLLENQYCSYIWEYLQNILVIHQLNVDDKTTMVINKL